MAKKAAIIDELMIKLDGILLCDFSSQSTDTSISFTSIYVRDRQCAFMFVRFSSIIAFLISVEDSSTFLVFIADLRRVEAAKTLN